MDHGSIRNLEYISFIHMYIHIRISNSIIAVAIEKHCLLSLETEKGKEKITYAKLILHFFTPS